jgi:hypothetical protein
VNDSRLPKLTEQEAVFIRRRESLIRSWPWMGRALLLAVVALGVYLYTQNPLLVNPNAVRRALDDQSIPPVMMTLLVSFLPIAVSACLVLMLVIVLLAFAAFGNERNLLKIIRRLGGERR